MCSTSLFLQGAAVAKTLQDRSLVSLETRHLGVADFRQSKGERERINSAKSNMLAKVRDNNQAAVEAIADYAAAHATESIPLIHTLTHTSTRQHESVFSNTSACALHDPSRLVSCALHSSIGPEEKEGGWR